MIAFEDLLIGLAGDLALQAGDVDAGVIVRVTAMDLDVPVEARIAPDGRLIATLPRNRLATGFDPPAGRLTMRIGRQS